MVKKKFFTMSTFSSNPAKALLVDIQAGKAKRRTIVQDDTELQAQLKESLVQFKQRTLACLTFPSQEFLSQTFGGQKSVFEALIDAVFDIKTVSFRAEIGKVVYPSLQVKKNAEDSSYVDSIMSINGELSKCPVFDGDYPVFSVERIGYESIEFGMFFFKKE